MADTYTGTPYVAALPILDDLGDPVESGVSGTMLVTSPTGATVSGAVVHQGGGVWGLPLAGTFLAAQGTYRFNVATLTVGATTRYDQGGTFVVGERLAHHRTLREILTSIYTALQDGLVGTGVGGTNTLTDTARSGSGIDNNEWVGSEIVILGPTASIPAINPLVVDSFVASTGVFTLKPNTTLSGAAIDYLLCNRNGAGYPYAEVREALDTTIGSVRLRERVTDTVSLTTTTGREYALPAGWRSIESVAVGWSDRADTWDEVAPGYWEWDAGRHTFRDKYGLFTPNLPLRLTGTIDVPTPTRLGAIVPLNWTWVRDMALAELLVTSENPADQRRAALLLDRARRAKPSMLMG